MDPDSVLKRARRLAEQIIETVDRGPDTLDALSAVQRMEERAIDLACTFQALDTWIIGGGFPPRGWGGPRPRPVSTHGETHAYCTRIECVICRG